MDKKKFIEFLADVFVKIFQIIFALLVVGSLIHEQFNLSLFVFGLISSSSILTLAIWMHYNYVAGGGL